jgi:hypothetical protein
VARAVGAAGTAALLAVVCGCSGSGHKDTSGHPSPSAPTSAPVASAAPTGTPVPVPTFTGRPTLTEGQLRAITFQDGATPGTREMSVSDLADRTADSLPPVTPEACRNVVDIVAANSAKVGVDQLINWMDDIYPGDTTLAAYPHGGAAKLFSALEADLPQCRTLSGTNFSGDRFTSHVVVESAPKVGDKAVRYQEASRVPPDGRFKYNDIVVVRVGDTLATFTMVDIGRQTPFPSDLIAQQVRRLAAAQHGAS